MMAAAQPFISGAISKTVNMPNHATALDIANAYMMAWELGLKAIAVYRDGSKGAQPLSVSEDGTKAGMEQRGMTEAVLSKREKRKLAGPRREHLPDTRTSKTHKFNVSGHEGYITVGLYPDGRVGEMFITMAKEGGTLRGLMDCFATAVSMSLQYGVPLRVYIDKFSHTKFDPHGHTKNPDIPIAKSLVDYIFRWLGRTFLPEAYVPSSKESRWDGKERRNGKPMEENKKNSPAKPETMSVKKIDVIDSSVADPVAGNFTISTIDDLPYKDYQMDAPMCDGCGAITVRNGNCYLCYNCGKSMGCS
jgi:ribonucleoside-diphosphate reductase alpha chain